MVGVNKDDLLEEGFNLDQLSLIVDWKENLKNSVENGYILDGNIITLVAYNFLPWTLAFAKVLGIEVNPKMFGLK